MPGEGRLSDNMRHSFNYGNVHAAMFNGEVSLALLSQQAWCRCYFRCDDEQAWYENGDIDEQWTWLKTDLEEVRFSEFVPTVFVSFICFSNLRAGVQTSKSRCSPIHYCSVTSANVLLSTSTSNNFSRVVLILSIFAVSIGSGTRRVPRSRFSYKSGRKWWQRSWTTSQEVSVFIYSKMLKAPWLM